MNAQEECIASNRLAPWLAAAFGALATIALLYPGQYPFDSAYQLWQARTGHFNNVSPVAMTALWSVLLATGAGPALLFCLNLALFWTGIALSIDALGRSAPARTVWVIALGAAPLILVEMAHLLSDAHLAAVLVLATGLAARALTRAGPAALPACLAALAYAGAVRHNALPALLPYGALLAVASTPLRAPRWCVALAGAAALCAASLAGTYVLDRTLTRERATVWPSIALWDLAAMSVETGTLLLPPFTHGAALTVRELVATGAFDRRSNTLLFQKTSSGMRDGLGNPYSPAELRALRGAWIDAVRDHPAAYLRHRLRTFWLLIGPHPGEAAGAAYFVARTAYRDNPPLPQAFAPAAQAAFYAFADRLRAGWLFAALPYLLLAVLAIVVAGVRRRAPNALLAATVAASALLYAATFIPLAPGAELRYLTWPIVAGPLALALALSKDAAGGAAPVKWNAASFRLRSP